MVDIGPAAGDARAYFLKDTIKQVSPTVRSARIILSYKKARFGLDKNFNDDPNQRHLSFGTTYYTNCKSHTIAQSGSTMYSEGIGAGKIVKAFADDIPPPKFIGPSNSPVGTESLALSLKRSANIGFCEYLQLHALAYNHGIFLRTLATPQPLKDWSLTSLKEKLIKIGVKVVRHGRYVAFQMAEVAIPLASAL